MAGLCNWWGWTATCGLAATAITDIVGPALAPALPPLVLSTAILTGLVAIALSGLRATIGAAFVAAFVVVILVFAAVWSPIAAGMVHPWRLSKITLTTPFGGRFGQVSSVMAGLFQVGYAAPAIEGVLCYVGDARDPARSIRRALLAIVAVGAIFFIILPVTWYCALGTEGLSVGMDRALGPAFAPLLDGGAKVAAMGMVVFCWVLTTLQGFAGSPRTLAQLAEDGMAPGILQRRSRRGVPVPATLFTAGAALAIAMLNDSVWLQGAANFAYLIGLFLPSVAVCLLRRNAANAARQWRAPPGLVNAGLAAGLAWLAVAILGCQQFGLPTILLGLAMVYSGAAFYALRKIEDHRRDGARRFARSLYMDVMLILLVVLALDAVGYVVALQRISRDDPSRVAMLDDIFIAVAILNITVGVLLPGRIANTAEQISKAARQLATGALRDFSIALESLGHGDLEGARLNSVIEPIRVASGRELGAMTLSINAIQAEVSQAAIGLERARQGLLTARKELTVTNLQLHERIGEQERLAQELSKARDAAEAGERSKAEFLAMISHELRTPLNGVIGLAGLLMDGSLDAQSRIYAKMLREAGDHLLSLINDLLDFTKLEAGRLEFEDVAFELDGVVQSALDLEAYRAHAKSLEIGAFVSPDIPPVLIGDPGRLRQILLNLLGNAVKFTETGSVTVSVTPWLRSNQDIVLAFTVADTGIGIREEDIPHLFEEFNQLDSSISRKFGGTGLGLAICHRLVARMGGEISVDSTFGQGTEFCFTVKLKVGSPAAGEQPRGSARLHGERIMVLTGNDVIGRLFARQIRSRGGVVHRAERPRAALDILRQALAAGTPCHAVLIDQALPEEGAVDVARQIRADPLLRQTRVVLVSGSDFGLESPAPGVELFDERLFKPVPVDTLIFRLRGANVAAMSLQNQQESAQPIDAIGHKLRILVAEDNQTNQAVIRALLGKLGHRADVVANGLEAVEAVRERPYDLVLMDVMMPEMDGVTATREIRALPDSAGRVPVFALTADVSSDHHAAFLAAGMQSVLLKPVTLKSLQSALADLEAGLTGRVPPGGIGTVGKKRDASTDESLA
jgi:signal transduction histidine kinase/CheY-like chemotaxis protein/L-asparagine transporter-like permease